MSACSDASTLCESLVSGDIETINHVYRTMLSDPADTADSDTDDRLSLLMAAACKHPPPHSWLYWGFHPVVEAACEAWRTASRRRRTVFAPCIPVLYLISSIVEDRELPSHFEIPILCIFGLLAACRLKSDTSFNGVCEIMYMAGASWRAAMAAAREPVYFDGTDAQLCIIVHHFIFFCAMPLLAKLVLDPPFRCTVGLHLGPCIAYLSAICNTDAIMQPQIYLLLLFLPLIGLTLLENNRRLSFIEALTIARLERQVANLEYTVKDAHQDALVLEEYRSLLCEDL